MKIPFLGASYALDSLDAAAQRSLNLFVESIEQGPERSQVRMRNTPGLSVFCTLPQAPVRGLWAGENRLFAVAGSHLYEIIATLNGDGSYSYSSTHDYGSVGSGTGPVQIFPNGAQLCVIAGGNLYVSTGGSPALQYYIPAQGYVTVVAGQAGYSGTLSVSGIGQTLLWDSGDHFTSAMIGRTITLTISGSPQKFTVSAYLNSTTAYLATAATVGGPYNFTIDQIGSKATLTYGDYFDPSMVGQAIVVDGNPYTVATYIDVFNLTLSDSTVTGTNVTYEIANSGTVNTQDLTDGSHAVQWVSGDLFSYALGPQTPGGTGQNIVINNSAYTVKSVIDAKNLLLTSSAGVHTKVAYTAVIPVTASNGAFLDSYFIAITPNTKQLNISAPNNGTKWDPGDYAIKEGYPDNILACLADHEELWLFGSQTIEVWRNTGNADFPLQRDPGAFIHMGLAATWTPARLAGGVAWLGTDARGGPVAYRAQGYAPIRVSTHAIEQTWSKYTTVADAESFSYTDQGHEFWQITFPQANATWVYDATTGLWHERADAQGNRHRARCHAYEFGLHLVGDYSSGNVYVMSESTYNEAGYSGAGNVTRIRTGVHLSNERNFTFYSRFRIDQEYNASLTDILDWSDDGGHTFSNTKTLRAVCAATAGKIVGYEFRRLGRSRSRLFRLSITGNARVSLIDAYIETGQ